MAPLGDNDWFTSNVVVTLTAEDDSSGVDYTMYKLEDDTEWQEYTGPILVTEDGEHTIEYYSVDKVGNEEEDKGPFGFKIDQTAPEIIHLQWEKTGLLKWLFTATVDDETSGINKVEFYVDDEYLGNVTEEPYEWVYYGSAEYVQIIVYDNAGNLALSEKVTPHSQSPSQSSSNSVVQKNIMSNPEATGDPKAELDVGRVWLRGLLWHCNRVGNVNHALALRLHYIEFTGTERTAGIVTDNHVIFKDSAYTGRMYEVGTGLFTYIIGFFEGGLEIL